MKSHGLTEAHLAIIRRILQPFADHITLVGLFGSRATGKYRPNSDVDMVLYGTLNEAEVDRIATLFSESLLPFTVDIQSYEKIAYLPLKAHIDVVMQPLFSQEILKESLP